MSDEKPDVYAVVLARDVRTDVGILAAGTPVRAVPSDDDAWLVEMSLPMHGVPPHPFRVAAGCVRHGRHLLNQRAALYDYEFARHTLGLSHESAVSWIRQGYDVNERQLYRWGLSQTALGEKS